MRTHLHERALPTNRGYGPFMLQHNPRDLDNRDTHHYGGSMTTTTPATMLVLDANHVAVSAGRYYLGDPCYPFPNDGPDNHLWMELLRSCAFFSATPDAHAEARFGPWTGTPGPVGVVTLNGVTYPIVSFSTAHGDGGYMGTDGFEYGVDAGQIGLVPMALVEALNTDLVWLAGCGTIIDTNIGFMAETDGNGRLTFDTVAINTSDDPDDEDNECFACGYPMPGGYCERRGCTNNADEDDEDED